SERSLSGLDFPRQRLSDGAGDLPFVVDLRRRHASCQPEQPRLAEQMHEVVHVSELLAEIEVVLALCMRDLDVVGEMRADAEGRLVEPEIVHGPQHVQYLAAPLVLAAGKHVAERKIVTLYRG